VIRLKTGSYALRQEQSWWAKLQEMGLILILTSSLCLPTCALFTNGFTVATNNGGLLMTACLTRNLYILNAATLLAIWFSSRQLAWQQELEKNNGLMQIKVVSQILMTEILKNALQSVQIIIIPFNRWSCNNTITVFDETDPSSACSIFPLRGRYLRSIWDQIPKLS